MSSFRRTDHWRTNAHGTRFHVREHDVTRHGEIPVPAQTNAVPIEVGSGNGFLNPNAACPVCGDRVYFLKASNGGRVFLDTAWPDWGRHPCTIPVDAEIPAWRFGTSGDGSPGINPGAAPGTPLPASDGSLLVEFLPRPGGTVVALSDGETTRHVTAELDLTLRYFASGWLSSDGSELTLLAADMRRIKVPVTPCAEPPPLTTSTRIALTAAMKDHAIAVARRIEGMTGKMLVSHPSCGTFVAGVVGDMRVAVIPVPMDHAEFVPVFSEVESIADMACAAIAVMGRETPHKAGLVAEDQVVFAVLDPLGCAGDRLKETLGKGAGQVLGEDAFLFEDRKLLAAGLRHFRWEIATARHPVKIGWRRMRVGTVLAQDEAFCAENWAPSVEGRWRKVEELFERMGAGAVFGALHRGLARAGWRPEHDALEPSVVRYLPVTGGDRSIRLLPHMTRDGAVSLIVNPDERASFDPETVVVLGASEVPGFVERMAKKLRRKPTITSRVPGRP